MATASAPRAAALVAGNIIMWASEINLMKDVKTWDPCLYALPPPSLPPSLPPPPPRRPAHSDDGGDHAACPWSHPIFVGVALKMFFVLVLPPGLAALGWQRRHEWPRRPLVDRRFFVLSLALACFMLGASVTWVASIPLTVPSINAALYQLYTPLTYVFSIPILREALSFSKALGVLLALASVLMILLSKATSESGTPARSELVGDLLVLASAALYAVKGVVYKRWLGSSPAVGIAVEETLAGPAPALAAAGAQMPCVAESADDESRVLKPSLFVHTPLADAAVTVGLMGFWSCFIGPLVILAAHMSGVEPFSWPPLVMLRGYLIVELMMAIAMGCLYGALAYATPTFVSVCSLFVEPVTLVWDAAVGRTASISYMAFLGVGLLLIALCLVICADDIDEIVRVRARHCCRGTQQPLLCDASPTPPRRSATPRWSSAAPSVHSGSLVQYGTPSTAVQRACTARAEGAEGEQG